MKYILKGVVVLAFEVNFYKTADGYCPVETFFNSLDKKMVAKLLKGVILLEEFGNKLREPYSKSLDNGIFELRAKHSSNITRVLYFFIENHKIILTNGFVKKSQKTPISEIEKAKNYRTDYLKRKEQCL